ncbi:hypothetical protein fugu_002030 [Takifugu bimaculatus]|uniref:E3 ubiquitin-protein ligase n=1 Tax=Takifugu bimaculatus TaxID=433685 RepID=A0A4Z2BNK2_9TELE|nr:hypothetical protein fugu_002030 [Takifugu bimaculatus]
MLLASAVVVWEWLNEHGRWRPYSPAVCHHIEAVIRSDPRCGSVVLGQVDLRLSPYIIDLHSMHQFRQDTGTLRPVRRSFYDPNTAPGQGWLWEWENDTGSWTAYDTEVGIAIQAAHDRQQSWLDLAPLGFCYLIDFENMTQINGQTQRCRRIQRRSDLAYPLVSGPLPKSHHAWGPMSMPSQGGLLGPCACQQCMLVLSVKAGAMSAAQTLGRRPPQTKPPSPKFSSHQIPGGSYSLTLPRPPALSRSFSPHRTSVVGATGGYTVDPGGIVGGSSVASATLGFGGGFNNSFSFLNSATAALSISSTRPPPPPLPPPPPPPPPSTTLASASTSASQPSTSSSLSTLLDRPSGSRSGPTADLHGLLHLHALTFRSGPGSRVLVGCRLCRASAAQVQPRWAEPTSTAAHRDGPVTCSYCLWSANCSCEEPERFQPCAPCTGRNHGDSDERGRTSCLPDSPPQACASPSTGQQE